MKIRITAAFLAAAVAACTLTACGEKTSSKPVSSAPQSSSAASSKAASSAVSSQPADRMMAVGAAVNVSIGPEPASLDPARSTGADTDAYAAAAFEGLYKVDANGNVVLGQAAKAECSSDKKIWTFTLRDDAQWSDGTPVTAENFVYAWQRAVALDDAQQKYLFAYLKNGTAILNGTQLDARTLGVTAKNSKTLVVTLTAACNVLPQLLVQPIFMPLREDVVSKNKDWSRSPDTFICNGPMKLTQWNIKSNIMFERSETYYNKDAVTASGLNCSLAEDDEARLSAYDNNECEFTFPLPVKYFARIRERGDLNAVNTNTTACLQFNTNVNGLSDAQVRKALSLAVDRDTLAAAATGMRFTAASAFVPTGYSDAGGKNDFRTVGGTYYSTAAADYVANVTSAKLLLEHAGYADGKNFPELTITVPISTLASTIANAVADMWKKNLGINCKVEQQPYSAYLDSCKNGKVQVAVSELTAEFADPAAVLENFTVGSSQNITGWADKTFTEQMDKSRQCAVGTANRYKALHAAEKRLVEEAPAAALFYMPTMSLRDSKLNGVFTAKNGISYFAYANKFNG